MTFAYKEYLRLEYATIDTNGILLNGHIAHYLYNVCGKNVSSTRTQLINDNVFPTNKCDPKKLT